MVDYVPLMLVMDLGIVLFMAIAVIDSWNEKEDRAVMISFVGFVFHVVLGLALVLYPLVQQVGMIYFGAIAVFGLLMLIPGPTNEKALKGTLGYMVGDVEKPDERDIVFSRRILRPGSEEYKEYYAAHPEWEAMDKHIRDKGGMFASGGIDDAPMNDHMIHSGFMIPGYLSPYADRKPDESHPKPEVTIEEATDVVKSFTKHLGASAVGICEVNPKLVYSHRGEIRGKWEDWGKEIGEMPKYAVVFSVPMNFEHVMAAPHTTTEVEVGYRYAQGAFISTMVAHWFQGMGYRGIAQHSSHYDVVVPPLAVDAGLGEIGRNGFLITPGEGTRTRAFAILTDMPLLTDKPISLGVEEYCKVCEKCATTCPSKSIPLGDMTVHNGVEKWKTDSSTCYEYWHAVGTGCAVCMAVCSFGRPNTPLHAIVKWFIKRRNPLALRIFPHIDDLFYGKDWKPRKVTGWMKYN